MHIASPFFYSPVHWLPIIPVLIVGILAARITESRIPTATTTSQLINSLISKM